MRQKVASKGNITVNFTRDPIIESIITPREGCKLVIRSSKSAGQEEFFVDAIEVVSYGNALFFRSLERPKPFLVPASDYEVLEVREARMVLKHVGVDRAIKIGGGKASKEKEAAVPSYEKAEAAKAEEVPQEGAEEPVAVPETKGEGRSERRRDRRRQSGRKRRDETKAVAAPAEAVAAPAAEPGEPISAEEAATTKPKAPGLLPPPSTLISETIARYRDNALFKEAFYVKEESQEREEGEEAQEAPTEQATSGSRGEHPEDLLEAMELQDISLEPSEFGLFGHAEEAPFLPEKEEQTKGTRNKE